MEANHSSATAVSEGCQERRPPRMTLFGQDEGVSRAMERPKWVWEGLKRKCAVDSKNQKREDNGNRIQRTKDRRVECEKTCQSSAKVVPEECQERHTLRSALRWRR